MGTPATFGSTQLGTEDCWIETSSEPGRDVYIVHAQQINRSGRKYEIQGSTRATIESIQKTYHDLLKPQDLLQYAEIVEVPQYAPRATAVSGTLAHSFTSLSVAGCYCTAISITDEGHRFVDIEFTFEKPVVVSGTAVATFNSVNLGNEPCWIETEWAPGKVIYTVHGQYTAVASTARQSAIELLGKTFGDSFKPGPLVEYQGGGKNPTYMASPWGVKAALVHAATSLNEADCYCTEIRVNDTGQRFATLDFVFEKPVFDTGIAEPDTVDFTWDGNNIGDQPGTWQESIEPSFLRYTVTTAYRGTSSPQTYLSTLASSLGLDQLFLLEVPRGSPGARGIIKSYNQASGSLVWVSKSTTITDAYPESLEATPLENGGINITATFVKVR